MQREAAVRGEGRHLYSRFFLPAGRQPRIVDEAESPSVFDDSGRIGYLSGGGQSTVDVAGSRGCSPRCRWMSERMRRRQYGASIVCVHASRRVACLWRWS